MRIITRTLLGLAAFGSLTATAGAIEPLSDAALDAVQGGVLDAEVAVPVAAGGDGNTASSQMNDSNTLTNNGDQQIAAQDNSVALVDQSSSATDSYNDDSTSVAVEAEICNVGNDNSTVDSNDDNSLDSTTEVVSSYNDNSTNDDSTHETTDSSLSVELCGNAQQNAQGLAIVNTLGDVGSAMNINSTSLSAAGGIDGALAASIAFNQVSANFSAVFIGGGGGGPVVLPAFAD